MARFENVALFDPEAGERVDVEEAAIIHVAGGDAPIGEPVGLLFEQVVQRTEAFRPALDPVQNFDRALDRVQQSRLAANGAGKPLLDLLGARPEIGPPTRGRLARHAAQVADDRQHVGADGGCS